MKPTEKEIFERWMSFSRFLARTSRSDDFKSRLSQFLATLEVKLDNPRAAAKAEPTDALERWAAGRKDPGTFRPSTVLREDYVAWCARVEERPGTLTAFHAELKKRTWLRKGRTKVRGVSRNGWWGLRT